MAVLIQSKFVSSCKNCKGKVAVGAPVFWTPGEKGVVHQECPAFKEPTEPIKIDNMLTLGDFTKIEGFESLYDHQTEAVNAVKAGHNRLYLGWEPGLGKAQPLDSKVLTANGFMDMGEISVGSVVITPSGEMSRVTGVYPQGEEDVYSITMTDGSTTRASGEHLWTLIKTSRGRGGTRHKKVTLTTKELINSSLQELDGRSRYRLPDINVSGTDDGITVHPYLLGALLGDGGMTTDCIMFSSGDPEMFGYLEEYLPDPVKLVGVSNPVDRRLSIGKAGGGVNPLTRQMRTLGLMGKGSHSKFIPEAYRYATRKSKIELVRGLMDTDGYVSKDNALEFCSVSLDLAQGFADVIRSLGGYARLAPKKTSWTHKGIKKYGSAYRVVFNCDFNPFRLRRKAQVWRPVRQRQRRIKSIEYAGREQTQCIMIDHKDHLYVTDNYIPTHNTAGSLASAHADNAFPLVIVCPSVVKINWKRETQHWLGKEAQVLSGRTPYAIESDIVIINYDILSYWVDDLIALNPRGLVLDEIHYSKNIQSKRTKAAKALADATDGMVFGLSGTPTPNSVYDLVQPLSMLGALEHFGGARKYIKRYCPPVQTRWGTSYAKARHLPELHQNLKNTCLIRRTKEDCLDLPEKTMVDIPVDVSVSADDFYTDLVSQMRSATITEARRVARTIPAADRKGQIMAERAAAGELKVQAIIDLAKDIDVPQVVMVHHKSVQAAVVKGLSKHKSVVHLKGGLSEKRRQEAIDKFQEGEADVIVCSMSAAGIGINLQRGQSMIIGELPMTYAELDQAISRSHRSGQTNNLTVYRVIALGTADEALIGMINRKEATSAAVEDGKIIDTVAPHDIIAHRLLELYKAR